MASGVRPAKREGATIVLLKAIYKLVVSKRVQDTQMKKIEKNRGQNTILPNILQIGHSLEQAIDRDYSVRFRNLETDDCEDDTLL